MLPFGEYMASSGLLRLTRSRFQNFGSFLTGSSPVRVILYRYSRCPGLPASSLPVCPVYRFCFFVPPRHPGLPVVCRYTGVVNFFMLAEPLLLLHTPTHAAAHNTTQHAGCCGQQPTLAYTPCHVRQENYANLVTALPPQNSPAAAHAEVACTAFAVILMTTRKSTASANHALQQRSLPAVPMTTRMRPSVKREGVFYNKAHRKNEKARPTSGSLWGTCGRFPRYTGLPDCPVYRFFLVLPLQAGKSGHRMYFHFI